MNVTRAGVTLCDRGEVKIGQKKRYVIVERPLRVWKPIKEEEFEVRPIVI